MAEFITGSMFVIFILLFANVSRIVAQDIPVCATNGTHWFLFKNKCRFNTENAKRVSNPLKKMRIGNCFTGCNRMCSKEYSPICAVSGGVQRTFNNKCMLDLENCESSWQIIQEGECPTPTISPLTTMTTQPSTVTPPDTAPTTETTTILPSTQSTTMLSMIALSTTPLPPITERPCPTACTLEYRPVCASVSDVELTFPNKCALEANKCKTGLNWQIKYEGECEESEPECDQDCPKIYSPICASYNGENRTFNNECLLDVEMCLSRNPWTILYKGECRKPADICPTICPAIYQPVCASLKGNLRTFSNKCALSAEICKTKNPWITEYNGECKPIPPPIPLTFPPTIPPTTSPTSLSLPPTTQACPEVCPFFYEPICGSLEGKTKTFPNKCTFDSETCKSGENWIILYEGECALPLTTITPRRPLRNCPNVCPSIFDPVCATLNGTERTFFNGCELSSESCRTGEPWEVIGAGDCSNITTIPNICPQCTNVYEPICGFSNGVQKTFINNCQLLGANCNSDRKWVRVYDGECKVTDQPRNCPNICPIYFDPVCATFQGVKRTFPNECELNHESFITDSQWVVLYSGECDYCPVCTDEIAIVCGEYNDKHQVFDNLCKMEYENCKTGSSWRKVSKSMCIQDNCPNFCPDIYFPVCATYNGVNKTFGNTCEMNRESCATNTIWIIVSDGQCPSIVIPQVSPPAPMSSPSSTILPYPLILPSPPCPPSPPSSPAPSNPVRPPSPPSPPTPPNPLRPSIPLEEMSYAQFLSLLLQHYQSSPQKYTLPTCAHDVPNYPVDNYLAPFPPPPKCEIVNCKPIYDPICAIYNDVERTFSNTCFLQNTMCQYNQDWVVISNGPCMTAIPKREAFKNPMVAAEYVQISIP